MSKSGWWGADGFRHASQIEKITLRTNSQVVYLLGAGNSTRRSKSSPHGIAGQTNGGFENPTGGNLKGVLTEYKIPFPASTFERMFRYGKYGYFPCRETKVRMIQALREMPVVPDMAFSLYDGLD